MTTTFCAAFSRSSNRNLLPQPGRPFGAWPWRESERPRSPPHWVPPSTPSFWPSRACCDGCGKRREVWWISRELDGSHDRVALAGHYIIRKSSCFTRFAMTTQWYYVHDAKRLGPFTARQLAELAAAGKILPTDTVWKEGMEKGVPAEKVKNLLAHAQADAGLPDPAGVCWTPSETPHIEAMPGMARLEVGHITLTFKEQVDGVISELAPDLPGPVFYCTESWHAERIGAGAIYCSDGRWGEAFDEFCHRHLQIPRYDRLAVAGGPAWLAAQ